MVEIRAQRGVYQREQVAQDAILVKHGDAVEFARDPLFDLGPLCLAALGVKPVRWVEHRIEQPKQLRGDGCMLVQHLGDVNHAVTRPALPVIKAVSA